MHRDERGTSLVEVMLVSVLLVVVAGALVGLLSAFVRGEHHA